MSRSFISPRKAIATVLAGAGLIALLSITVNKLNLVDQAKGALGVSASCDDINLSNLGRVFARKSGTGGVAFRPYAEALEKCGTLNGQSRSFVRSTFGSHFDFGSRRDSWLIDYGFGLFGEGRSISVTYSEDGLVTSVELLTTQTS